MICLEANYHSSSHLFDSSLLVLHCTMYTIGNTWWHPLVPGFNHQVTYREEWTFHKRILNMVGLEGLDSGNIYHVT